MRKTLIHREYVQAISDSSRLVHDLDFEPILETLVQDACAIAHTSDGYIALLDADGETLRLRYGVGIHSSRAGFTLSRGLGSSGVTLRSGQTSIVEDYRVWPDRIDDPPLARMSTIITVPITVGDVTVGVLALSWCDRPYRLPQTAIDAINRYARMCSLALGNAMLRAEARQQQAILEALNKRLAFLFDASPAAMSIRSLTTWRYVAVNSSWLKTMGFTADEVLGRTPAELGVTVDHEQDASFRDGRLPCQYPVEIPARTKDGEIRHFLANVSLLDISGEPCMHIASIDITLLRRYERKMQQLDRLNLVGEMAASIGHEVRNPMTAVRGYLQFFRGRRGFGKYHGAIDLMIGEIDRANAIISEFLSLAKDRRIERKPGNLDSIIRAICPLIETDAVRRGHNLVIEAGGVPDILLDENGIRQLLLNLVTNALEAMPAGGTVVIRTQSATDEVLLEIADNGPGIPADILARIGTPFVTTKDHGTGLGLAVCHRIAANHGAALAVKTGDAGTTFTVTFPRPEVSK